MSFLNPHFGITTNLALQLRVFFGQKHPIAIADLFNRSVEKGWAMFWDQGKKHYREMLFYELLSQAGDERYGGGSNRSQGTSEQSINPINMDATG